MPTRRPDILWAAVCLVVVTAAVGHAGPVREEERVVSAELDLDLVRTARRFFDPVGHYNRPDVFRLAVDTAPRPAVVEMGLVSDVD